MNKRIGIVGSYNHIDPYNLSTDKLVSLTTKNIGNLMFRYAVSKDVGKFVRLDTSMSGAEVREKVDLIVFPMANNINPSFNMGPTARFIENASLPIIVVGLGAQAKLGETFSKDLPEGSKRFLSLISEYATEVGVRGNFTANVLEQFGVKNSTVIGCPSNFINPARNLGKKLQDRFDEIYKEGVSKVGIYSQLGGKNFEEPNLDSEKKLYELVYRENTSYIHNFPKELIDYSRGGYETKNRWKKKLNEYLDPDLDFSEFDKKFRRSSHAFATIESWLEYSRGIDFSLGKRVHGCLNTIQSGTPSALIVHDERTKELANIIGLPVCDSSVLERCDTLDEIVREVEFNSSLYNRKRKLLFKSYNKIFKDSGVKNNNALADVWAEEQKPALAA